MGRLSSPERECELGTQTVVGRDRKADLQIPSAYVSGLHALVQWQRSGWTVKDLGSHNGTLINGALIRAGEQWRISMGDELAFGDQSFTWTLTDDSPPEPRAVAADATVVTGHQGILVLPEPSTPTATVWCSPGGTWRLESPEGVRTVTYDEVLTLEGETWQLELPRVPEKTRRGARSRGPVEITRSHVRLEQRGDRVSMEVVADSGESTQLDVGAAGPMLEYLGRARSRDEAGGWVERDELLSALSMRANHMNVLVYRLRQQLAGLGFQDARDIINRKGRLLRLGGREVTWRAGSSDDGRRV